MALFCRWAIPQWLTHSQYRKCCLWVVDWDESNALCNVQCNGLHEMCPESIVFDPWYQSFYDRLSIYVQTPFRLVGPDGMLHGGA